MQTIIITIGIVVIQLPFAVSFLVLGKAEPESTCMDKEKDCLIVRSYFTTMGILDSVLMIGLITALLLYVFRSLKIKKTGRCIWAIFYGL